MRKRRKRRGMKRETRKAGHLPATQRRRSPRLCEPSSWQSAYKPRPGKFSATWGGSWPSFCWPWLVRAVYVCCLFFLFEQPRPLIMTLAPSGITLPSAFSAIYFLLFISVCTWWACHLPISHLGFNALCVMVGFFTGGHLVCLYLYQRDRKSTRLNSSH